MYKRLILLICLFIFLSTFSVVDCKVFASTSANYAVSAEVMDLGGVASMDSNAYHLSSNLREISPAYSTSLNYTLEARFMGMVYGGGAVSSYEPVVTSVIPNAGVNNGSYRIVINGTNISTDAIATMEKSGQPPIEGTAVSIETSTSMEATFDINAAQAGIWNIIVTNTGYGQSSAATYGSRFTVSSPGPVSIIGTPHNDPNPFNPGEGKTEFKYTLSTSATISLYLFNQRGELVWQRTYSPSDPTGGKAGDNNPTWDGMTDFKESVPTGVYILHIVAKSGVSKELGRIKVAVLRQ